MLYHCFKELKPEYETIVISPSTLEKELAPKNPFITEQETKKKAATFWLWNIVEDIVWVTITKWKEAGYDKCKLWREYMNPVRMEFYSSGGTLDKTYQRVYEWLEKYVDLAMPYYGGDIYNLRSHNSLVECAASWYNVILKWECDRGIDWEYLYDCKTAKQAWKNDRRDLYCYQARFYSRMQFLSHPELDSISFTYLVFIKNKTPKLQDITHTLTRQECEDFVWDKLKEYLTKVHNGEIKATEEALDRL